MKTPRHAWFLSVIGLLIVLGLLGGCYRPAAPDVTATPGGAAATAPSESEQIATAAAESVRATEIATGATATVGAPTVPSSPSTATSTPTPTATPPTAVLPTSTPTPTSTPSSTGRVTHVVQRGENLFRIALRYGTTVQAIASANGIANPALIYVGQPLVIPSGTQPPPPSGGTTYVVQPGDNLFRIALRYNMNYVYLAQYNGIANPAYIYVGQVIRIPPR
jgi:LysM repeat protein